MKYIDAEKLIAEIERLKEETPIGICEYDKGEENGRMEVLTSLQSTIDSLQQEQPKFKVGDTIHKIGENTVFPMTIERIYDGDYVCVTEHQQSFINIKLQDDYELVEQEQPEVDFEKAYKSYMKSRKDDLSGNAVTVNMKDLAHYFWNKGLNARKEDIVI